LLEALPPLARAMAGLAMLSELRRGELFALRWRNLDEQQRLLIVREAVYEGCFDTLKTSAGVRQIPLSDGALKLVADWKARAKRIEPHGLVCSTWSGKPILAERHAAAADLSRVRRTRIQARDLAHVPPDVTHRGHMRRGYPGKVVAQLMGHAKVGTTLNVYTQVIDAALRVAVDKVGSELFTIVHNPGKRGRS
jgi:integrase